MTQVEGQFQSYNYANDDVTVWIYWGDGRRTAQVTEVWQDGDGNGTTYFRATYAYKDNSGTVPFTVTVRIDDDADVNQQTGRATNSVANLPPIVDPVANFAIREGLLLTFSGHITDPGTDDTFTGTVNYGDGTGVQPLSIIRNYYQLNLTYAANGVYTVTVNVTDDDGASASRTMQVLAGPVRNLLVTNTSDSGPGSLRQAVLDANAFSANGAAFPNAYAEIRFAPALSGQTITLTSGELLSSRPTQILATNLPGGISISGNNVSRILEVAAANKVILSGITLTNGNASSDFLGGAIFSRGQLILNECRIAGCTSTFYGGGLYIESGTVQLNRCTVSGNTSLRGSGGGVGKVGGVLALNQCTIVGNSASLDGGGVFVAGASSEASTLNHCTVSGNTAGNQGGGLFRSGGSLTVLNSIVAGNIQAAGDNISGTATFSGVNLTSGDPMLYPLGNYGGPTPTMPPRPGSPVIDAVTSVTIPAYTVPIAYWRLGEDDAEVPQGGSGTTTSTSNLYGAALIFNNPVTYTSAVAPSAAGWLDSRLGVSIGTGTYGTSGLIADFTGNTAITNNFGIELWVKPNNNITGLKCLAYNGDPGTNGWGIFLWNGYYGALLGGGFIGFGSTNPAVAGTWTHLALVCDNGVTRFYLNGVVTAFTPFPLTVPTGGFIVGGPSPFLPTQSAFFSGSLDEVRVFTFQPGQFSPDGLSYQPKPPLGFSYIPGAGDSAILADSSGAWSRDQRGYPRVSGPKADIGAVEIDQPIVRLPSDNGNGTLRQALADAMPPAIVKFANALAGRSIVLESEISVQKTPLLIDGGGLSASVTVDGGSGANRVMSIPAGTALELRDLSFTGGNGGGAISNLWGGAFLNQGTLTFDRCTFATNSASWGGVIFNATGATLALQRSTLSGNQAGTEAGAIYNHGTMSLLDTTVAGNTAASSRAIIYNVASQMLNLANSIVGGNNGSGVADLENLGTLHHNSVNLVQSLRQSGTQTGPAPLSAVPQLAPLSHYGSLTPTMPPLPGSPVINAGTASTFTTDQRGAARISGTAPDLGSVEAFDFSTVPLVDTDGDGTDDRLELAYFGNLTTYSTPSFASFPITGLPPIANGSVAWGDYDNDGRLDFLLAGRNGANPVSQLRRNTTPVTNTPPTAPIGLFATILGDSVTLSWNSAADDHTPASGLTYNVRVGTTSGGSELLAAHVDADNGFRRVPALGNAYLRHSLSLTGVTSDFYCSVQAVDTSFAGGALSAELYVPYLRVTTGPAGFVAPTSANITGTIHERPLPVAVWWEWGTTTDYGNATLAVTYPAGPDVLSFTGSLGGLEAGNTYHFRLVAQTAWGDSLGTTYGQDQSFTTPTFNNVTVAFGNLTNLAYWRLGENDPGAVTDGAPATSTLNNIDGGPALSLALGATYSTNVSTPAAARVGSDRSIYFSGGNFGVTPWLSSLTSNFGLELWAKPFNTILPGTNCLAYNGRTTSDGWGLYLTNGTYFAKFGGVTAFGSAPATSGTWTHLALVRDNRTSTLYVNGVPAGTSTAAPNPPTGSFAVATAPNLVGSDIFNGHVDEVRVFSFAPGSFTTNALLLINGGAPEVTTVAATAIGLNSATLNGSVNPQNLDTAAWFEWGPTINYGLATPASPLSGLAPLALSDTLGGLAPGITYHYRVAASNMLGTSYGLNQSFTTPAFMDVTAAAFPDGLSGVSFGSVAWADYDNDGRLDFLLTGRTTNFSAASQLWQKAAPVRCAKREPTRPRPTGSPSTPRWRAKRSCSPPGR